MLPHCVGDKESLITINSRIKALMSVVGPLPQHFHAFYWFLSCKHEKKKMGEMKVKDLKSAGRKNHHFYHYICYEFHINILITHIIANKVPEHTQNSLAPRQHLLLSHLQRKLKPTLTTWHLSTINMPRQKEHWQFTYNNEKCTGVPAVREAPPQGTQSL